MSTMRQIELKVFTGKEKHASSRIIKDYLMKACEEAGIPTTENFVYTVGPQHLHKIDKGTYIWYVYLNVPNFVAQALQEAKVKAAQTNNIAAFMHCKECIEELHLMNTPMSNKEYQRVEVGFTKTGFQVWCTRHDISVVTLEFPDGVRPKVIA